ncbi:MAG: serine/threonine protein kinase [Cyanobacteria bacterium HKST-UBA02]|nr:serine/threonine protein kinase [Cyanobacteria bacterium HKST-UBA02]
MDKEDDMDWLLNEFEEDGLLEPPELSSGLIPLVFGISMVSLIVCLGFGIPWHNFYRLDESSFLLLLLPLLILTGAIALLPGLASSHRLLSADQDGIRLRYNLSGELTGRENIEETIPWSALTEFAIDSPFWDPALLIVNFRTRDENGSFRLGRGTDWADESGFLRLAAEKFPELEDKCAALLENRPEAVPTFTELWLDSLETEHLRKRREELESGTVLDGRYRIKRRIGAGGQGTAYLAEGPGGDCLLKEYIIPETIEALAAAQKMDNREAGIMKDLSHQGLARLEAYFVEDMREYLVSEFVDGKSLRQLVEESGPLPQARIIAIGSAICDILEYLHGLSPPVVHLDVTPENIMVSSTPPDAGGVHLVDFTLAHRLDGTTTDIIGGKHSYMPPEQFQNAPCPESDIYSLGCTIVFMLLARDPEPLETTVLDAGELGISPGLAAVVSKATSQNIEERFGRASEMREALGLLIELDNAD